jgi:hypothetical protein
MRKPPLTGLILFPYMAVSVWAQSAATAPEPSNAASWRTRGLADLAAGRYRDAAADFTRAIRGKAIPACCLT